MTTAIIKEIKADYQQTLDSLAEEKQQLIEQRQELLKAQDILVRNKIDDIDVYLKIREVEDQISLVIKDIEMIHNDINNQIKAVQKEEIKKKKAIAFQVGVDAYKEGLENGSLVGVCPFKAMYLKKAFLKGFNHMVSMQGALGGGINYA